MAIVFGTVFALVVIFCIILKYYLGQSAGFGLNVVADVMAITVSAYVSWLISENQSKKDFQKNLEDARENIDDKLEFISEFAQRRVRILSNRIVNQANQLRDIEVSDIAVLGQIKLISQQISMLADDAEATHQEIGAISEKDKAHEKTPRKNPENATSGQESCPYCGTTNEYTLSLTPNSRTQVICTECKSRFFMHRSFKGKANMSFDYFDRYGNPQRVPARGDRAYVKHIPSVRKAVIPSSSLEETKDRVQEQFKTVDDDQNISALPCPTEDCRNKIIVRFEDDLKDGFRQLCFTCLRQSAVDLKHKSLVSPIKCEAAIVDSEGLKCASCSENLQARPLRILDGISYHRCLKCSLISSLS